jgi:hypothetical protein
MNKLMVNFRPPKKFLQLNRRQLLRGLENLPRLVAILEAFKDAEAAKY